MSHDELSDLLRSLPRETASVGFTARTIARTGESRRSIALARAFAMLLIGIVLLSGAIGFRRHRQQVRLQQLRIEQREMQKELDELKTLASERDPQVFVGSSGSYDFVVGLKQRSRSPGRSRPVSLHIANDAVF